MATGRMDNKLFKNNIATSERRRFGF